MNICVCVHVALKSNSITGHKAHFPRQLECQKTICCKIENSAAVGEKKANFVVLLTAQFGFFFECVKRYSAAMLWNGVAAYKAKAWCQKSAL